jgi:Probable Zinc-ribbon domain
LFSDQGCCLIFRNMVIFKSYDVATIRSYIVVMKTLNDIKHEWHKQNKKPINKYTYGSGFKAMWKCSVCGHEWTASICNRTLRESKCPECRKQNSRGNKNHQWNGYGEISGRHWHCIYTESHRRRNIPLEFTITIEYVWKLFLDQNRRCAFTGKELTMWGEKNGKSVGTASLDRIDSTKGYIDGNVQWIHKELQHMKRNLTDTEFIRICQEVASFQSKQKLSAFAIPSFEEWKKL